jgi:cytochrome c oxidase subunit 5b
MGSEARRCRVQTHSFRRSVSKPLNPITSAVYELCRIQPTEAARTRANNLETEIKSETDLIGPGAAPGTVPTDLEQATGLERLEILGKMQGIDIFDMSPLPSDRVGVFFWLLILPTFLQQATKFAFNNGKMLDAMLIYGLVVGTFKDPIRVKSAGEEIQCGCTGSPADSHVVRWVVVSLSSYIKTTDYDSCIFGENQFSDDLTDFIQVSRNRPYERCDECGSVYKMEYVGAPDDPHHHHHGYEEPKTMADYVKEDYWYR